MALIEGESFVGVVAGFKQTTTAPEDVTLHASFISKLLSKFSNGRLISAVMY